MTKRKPDFICLGTQKAGTTTLHDILKSHPDIYLPAVKEASFFNKDEAYANGADWWVENFFKQQKKNQVIGVFSPDYLFFKEVPGRIKETYEGDDFKVIIILRDPCERAYSQYLMSCKRGFEKQSFSEAIELEKDRLSSGEYFKRENYSYISRGHYLQQVKQYLSFIKRKNILFLSFENDIRENIDETIIRIQDFIGVQKKTLNTNIKSNVAGEVRSKKIQKLLGKDFLIKKIARKVFNENLRYRIRFFLRSLNETKSTTKKLNPTTKTVLFKKYFSGEVEELSELTGLDLSTWGKYKE